MENLSLIEIGTVFILILLWVSPLVLVIILLMRILQTLRNISEKR